MRPDGIRCDIATSRLAARVVALLAAMASAGAGAQATSYAYTGVAQSYTAPLEATAVYVQAAGGGGGGGGADQNGPGAAGGAGAAVTAIYPLSGGATLTVYVGGGGAPGHTSNYGHTCTNSAGAGGGGSGGYGGGAGGQAGCSGWSGGGAGGGGASVVTTSANATLIVAGGGGGGQGGSLNSSPVTSNSATATGALPASGGTTAVTPATGFDGGGGGGGGGGCAGGAAGSDHADSSGTKAGTAAGAGGSCAAATVSAYTLLAAAGGAGGAGDPANTGYPGGTAGQAGSVTITPLYPVGGTVYADANHNGSLDGGESGTALGSLYIKLSVSVGGVCQSTASAVAAVSSANGAYSLPIVLPGSYCLTLTNSASLANTTPFLPAGWLGTEAAPGVRQITVTTSPSAPQNFGLYNGSTLSVTTYADTGAGGGTANDGVRNGGEPGLAGITVTAVTATGTLAEGVTGGNGTLVLWLPASAAGSSLTVQAAAGAGLLATGGSAGTTGGAYSRPQVVFTLSAGSSYTGVAFGLVPVNVFVASGAQSVGPGGIVYYPHSYTAGSAGSLSLATVATPGPALAGWTEVVYQDPGCSGRYASGDPLLAGPLALVAGQVVCVLVREYAPATAPVGAGDRVTVSALYTYTGPAAPGAATLTLTDTTTVTGSGSLVLTKQVQNLTQGTALATSDSALPGQLLQYQITLANYGSQPATAVVVDDATPAYTTYVSAACPAPASLPPALGTCTVTTQPVVGGSGALQWTFTGTLSPGSQASVTFQVQVSP